MPVPTETLRHFSFLRSLDAEEIKLLAAEAQESQYPAGALIFPDGQVGDKLYLVRSGEVKIFKPTGAGEVALNVERAGDYFGEMSLIDEQPRSAAARAMTHVSLVEIPKAVFLSLVGRFPNLLLQTVRISDERLRVRDRELLAELEMHNQQLRQLYDTSLHISRHLELDAALNAIFQRASKLLNGCDGYLHLYDPKRNVLLPHGDGKIVRPGQGVAGRAFRTGEPVIQNTHRGMVACELAAPIQLDTRVLGTLSFERPPNAPAFNDDDARLLLLFANQAAVAIENARLYGLEREKGALDGELRVAREVQRSLIPTRVPRLAGFQFAGLWRPAREVAGDFYDYIPLPDHKHGIVIADVSDKGVPAAIFMAVSRSILRASAVAEAIPTRAIERANRLISADATGGMFVTVFYGILDARTRRFHYVNAGHNPPLLWRKKSGRLERLSQHALALGVTPDFEYESQQVELGAGDVLVLYTDGVTEAVNAGDELFGDARLAEIVKHTASTLPMMHAANAVIQAIDRGVKDFVGARPLADDVTMVVLSAASEKNK
jgi:serine phosphatase RsbU (regulator of sigma subunit)/CRP-like cAMP-binding protein